MFCAAARRCTVRVLTPSRCEALLLSIVQHRGCFRTQSCRGRDTLRERVRCERFGMHQAPRCRTAGDVRFPRRRCTRRCGVGGQSACERLDSPPIAGSSPRSRRWAATVLWSQFAICAIARSDAPGLASMARRICRLPPLRGSHRGGQLGGDVFGRLPALHADVLQAQRSASDPLDSGHRRDDVAGLVGLQAAEDQAFLDV